MGQLTKWMEEALTQAHKAFQQGEVPVGAVVVYEGKIIAASGNQTESPPNPLGHAEILALKQASEVLKTNKLIDCDLYVTLEPCPMCAGAISLARIRRLYFGAYDPKSGGVEHGARVFEHPTCHHKPEVIGGILEGECAGLLQSFFLDKRL